MNNLRYKYTCVVPEFRYSDFMYSLCCRAEEIFSNGGGLIEKMDLLASTLLGAAATLEHLQCSYRPRRVGKSHLRPVEAGERYENGEMKIHPVMLSSLEFRYSEFMINLCRDADELCSLDMDDETKIGELEKLLKRAARWLKIVVAQKTAEPMDWTLGNHL